MNNLTLLTISSFICADDSCHPLSSILPIPSAQLNLYRAAIILRLVILGFFFQYRVTHPVADGYGLWLTSVTCEIWLAFCWLLGQLPRWFPTNRTTYLDRLALRYEKDGEPSQLAPIDIFVSTVDPSKEPPLVTANTVLSILALSYPADKISCYVSDDGSDMLIFETLFETARFARKWVPFCKKYSIEPRAPEIYFGKKIDYLRDKTKPSFVKERRAMKRDYEEFKVRINYLAAKAQKMPEEGWVMSDGTPWPGNNPRDHPGMIQVLLGHCDDLDMDGNELPLLFYVSREKRPGFQHHKKAGAMNALLRVSAVLTNGAYVLNVDYDHYFNDSKALREAMCFLMDPELGNRTCFVQFPRRFDDADLHDQYANRNAVFFYIDLRCLDGIQGPIYAGSGCCFNRKALYGFDPALTEADLEPMIYWNCCCLRKKEKDGNKSYIDKKRTFQRTASTIPLLGIEDSDEEVEDRRLPPSSQGILERHFGQSPIFVASALMEQGRRPQSTSLNSLLKEAIHVISCAYEERTEWGKEFGWIYGSVTEDVATGFKMHARGWTSVYRMPTRPAFRGYAPISLSDHLSTASQHALGAVEILLSRHCPIWAGYNGRLKLLERLAYVNIVIYPLSSIPLTAYCALPAICLLTGKFIIPEEISYYAGVLFILLLFSVFASVILELRLRGVAFQDWWRNEQLWVVSGTSVSPFAVFQGLLKALTGIDINFSATSTPSSLDDGDSKFSEMHVFRWTTLLIPPTTVLLANLIGVVVGISYGINNGYQSWGPLVGKLLFAMWVIVHLQPFLKGLLGRQNRTPTVVIVWSILFISIFSLLWVHIAPFTSPTPDPATLVRVHM